jgi:hypothetical protein
MPARMCAEQKRSHTWREDVEVGGVFFVAGYIRNPTFGRDDWVVNREILSADTWKMQCQMGDPGDKLWFFQIRDEQLEFIHAD